MKLLIRNLARNTTEAELQALFEPLGKIQSCKLVLDPKTGQSKGFGFIEMPNPGQAKAAVKTLNGKELGGNKIRVKKAESKPANSDNSSKTVADKAATTVTKPSPVKKKQTVTATKKEQQSPKDPLHGITLEQIVTKLEDKYGWDELGSRIDIKCFTTDPSISSSLKFLRKTPWARKKVETLYLNTSWTKKASVWETARKNKKS